MKPQILQKLLDISRKMAENRLLDPLLEYAITVALELFDAEYGYLVLLNEDNSLDFRVRQDRTGKSLAEPQEQISSTIFEDVIQKRASLVVANASLDPDFQTAESVITLQLRSVMCVPLISRGAILGAIYIENRSKENIFSQEDLKPLEHFAAQAAVSIENAILNNELEARVEKRTAELESANQLLREEIEERKRIEKQLHHLAITDPLTGAFNRRHFFELAEKEFARIRQFNRQISIILCDVDYFKEVNDTFGHVAGDQLLRTIADRFNDNLRQMDIVARYGGDEFVVLLPDTNLQQAHQTAKRLHQVVTREAVETCKGAMPLCISMGVASLMNSDDIEKLLVKTDQALYKAKAAGRGQVIVYNGSAQKETPIRQKKPL